MVTEEKKPASMDSVKRRHVPTFHRSNAITVHHSDALALQRALGNEGLQRRPDALCSPDVRRAGVPSVQCNHCGACAHHAAEREEGELRVQPKLTVGRPGDVYELEADRVADQVMRMSDGDERLSVRPSVPNVESLQRQDEDEEEEFVQPKAVAGSITGESVGPDLAAPIQGLRGGGRALPPDERAFFEPRMGYDFSRVRLHTDDRANSLAGALNARAFTFGSDIAFSAGEYRPGLSDGRRLLAHELTHVMQQGAGGSKSTSIQRQMPLLNQEIVTSLCMNDPLAKQKYHFCMFVPDIPALFPYSGPIFEPKSYGTEDNDIHLPEGLKTKKSRTNFWSRLVKFYKKHTKYVF